MSDPLRTDQRTPALSEQEIAERDAKIENLLMAGLDHYFASDYAQAIDVWTRALFLDRTHARALAYIDRARSALGEQQRESEELIHNGVAAFERGEMEAARQLLNAAVQRGGAHEVALAFLTRIDRMSALQAPLPAASPAGTSSAASRVPVATSSGRRVAPVLIFLGLIAATVLGTTYSDRIRALVPGMGLPPGTQIEATPPKPLQEPLAVPLGSETSLERAQALFASGRLYDAIRAVDLVRPTDPLRPQADKLKEAIQRELLAHATP
jgi:hypothetical protein